MHKKDVSDTELHEYMALHLAEFKKDVVPRCWPKKTQKNENSGNVAKPPAGSQDIKLTDAEMELLESIYDEPFLGMIKRAARMGFSTGKMNTTKNSLQEKNLIEAYTPNLGKRHGGLVTMLALVGNSYKILGRKPKFKKPDNVSWEHFFWTMILKENYEKLGLNPVIEMLMNGKRADLGFPWNGKTIALEIELSPKHALTNQIADCAAGWDKVISCCKNSAVAKEVKKQLFSYKDYDSIKDKVEVRLLTDIELLK